jgi:hypothetical protein
VKFVTTGVESKVLDAGKLPESQLGVCTPFPKLQASPTFADDVMSKPGAVVILCNVLYWQSSKCRYMAAAMSCRNALVPKPLGLRHSQRCDGRSMMLLCGESHLILKMLTWS